MHLASLRRLTRAILLPPLAAIFLIEDLLVRSFGVAMGALTRLRLVARFEAWARRLRPWQALLLFLTPLIIFLPIHLLALWAFASRRPALGVAAYGFGKLAATAVIGRILIVCRPALMQYQWFGRAADWEMRTRTRLHGMIRATPAWQGYVRAREAARRALAPFRSAAGGGYRWWEAARRMARRKPVA